MAVWTHIQPAIGISAWNTANTAGISVILRLFIEVSFSPFASETEKASIASPTPSKNDVIITLTILNSSYFSAGDL